MRKWVMWIMLVFMIAGCSKPEAIVTPVVETPAPVETTPVVEAIPEPIIAPSNGRMIITIRDKLVKMKDVKSLTFTISEVKVHDEEKGEFVWKTLTTNTTMFNLTKIGETERVLVDAIVPPGKYTQLQFKIDDVKAVIGKTQYSVEIPDANLLILGVIDVRAGKTSTATLDFNIDKSLHLVAGTAYLRPAITVTTRRDATVTIENLTAQITGGEILTNRDQALNLTYSLAVLNASKAGCKNTCSDFCSDEYDDCGENCDSEISAGCQSDEEYCRKICEPLIHPSYCKYGCAILNDDDPDINDTIEACEDYLELGCTESCNMTRSDCDDTCKNECI